MAKKKILSWIALIGGEAIIIAAFILFRGGLANNILVLNIVVSSLIFGLYFVDILVPWIDLDETTQNNVGSIGLRWLFTWLYTITAIATMLFGNLAFEWSFALQTIIHCGLLFLLTLGFVFYYTSSEKVEEVFYKEHSCRSGIIEMKSAMRDLKDKMYNTTDIPEGMINRIMSLEESLRYISPANNSAAYDLEKSFSKMVYDISLSISDYKKNEEYIEISLQQLERIYQTRKSIYSI